MPSVGVIEPGLFREALGIAASIFAAERRTWWIQDGTLLGAVRQGGPIPGDTDIDVGMSAADFTWSILDRFTQAGFVVERVFGAPADGFEVRMAYRNLHFDIFLFYERGAARYCSGYFRDFKLDYLFEPFSLTSISYLGLDVPCPSPPERYLEAEYGPEWRVPTSRWHFAFSPRNASVRGSAGRRLRFRWARYRWHLRRQRRRLGQFLSAGQGVG